MIDTKRFEACVLETIHHFGLIRESDKVLVAASGGKDSTVLLDILSRHYDIEALTIDIGSGRYSHTNLGNLKRFCSDRTIRLHTLSFEEEFGMDLRKILDRIQISGYKPNPCTICGVLRRYMLNRKAREIGATKVATGHNLDDEAQSIMMNLLRNNLFLAARLGPITGLASDKLFVPRIKPLYLSSEKDIEVYSKTLGLPVLYERCPFARQSYRNTVRQLLDSYESDRPGTKKNIIISFQHLKPSLLQIAAGQEAGRYCESCGEPSQKARCRACEIISQIV